MSTSPAPSPLKDRSPNTSPTKPASSSSSSKIATKDSKPVPETMDSLRPSNKLLSAEEGSKQTYISPSDTILSPATQKISALKGKRFAAAASNREVPRSLFAKASIKNAANKSPDGAKGVGMGLGRDVGAEAATASGPAEEKEMEGEA